MERPPSWDDEAMATYVVLGGSEAEESRRETPDTQEAEASEKEAE